MRAFQASLALLIAKHQIGKKVGMSDAGLADNIVQVIKRFERGCTCDPLIRDGKTICTCPDGKQMLAVAIEELIYDLPELGKPTPGMPLKNIGVAITDGLIEWQLVGWRQNKSGKYRVIGRYVLTEKGKAKMQELEEKYRG